MRIKVQGSGLRVQGSFVMGLGCRVQVLNFRDLGLGFRVWVLGFGVEGLGLRV